MDAPTITQDATYDEKAFCFKKALSSLASGQISSPEEYCAFVDFFVQIYEGNNFRHRYSDILDALISDGDATKTLERSSCLSDNLHLLSSHSCCCDRKDHLCRKQELCNDPHFFKLCDHVELESKRLAIQNTATLDSLNVLKQTAKVLEQQRKDQDALQGVIDEQSKRLDSMNRETVSILGIFAAIVTTFVAAVAFTNSVFQNINAGSINRMLVLTMVSGLVMFDMLVSLFVFLTHVTNVEFRFLKFLSIGFNVLFVIMVCVVVMNYKFQFI